MRTLTMNLTQKMTRTLLAGLFLVNSSVYAVTGLSPDVTVGKADTQNKSQQMSPAEMPKGLWQAFSEARHLIEPVTNPDIDAKFRGQNPGNQMRFLFDEQGITFKSGHSEKEWTVGMQLTAYGSDAVATIKMQQEDNTLTYDRGNIQEWYINRPNGLEQGFTLQQAPQNHQTGTDISLSLQLSGDLIPELTAQSLRFYTQDKQYAFSYNKLIVKDANGQTLPAKMTLDPQSKQLQLSFNAAQAQWPIIVDPLVYTETKLVASGSDGATSDFFGRSVALSGDTALIGSEGDDDRGGPDSGSAYIFVRSGTVWTYQAKLTASDGQVGDGFGSSVALEGDTALIGARYDDDNGHNSGSAYIFMRSGTVWAQQAKLDAFDGAANDAFGGSVALSADTALIGAKGDDAESGSVYAFIRSSTVWFYQAKLIPAGVTVNDNFGGSVALEGNTALIGADGDDGTLGAAYIFERSGNVWTKQAYLFANDSAIGDFFGASVALDGDTALIGAWGDNDKGNLSGSAYIFVKPGGGWIQTGFFDAKLIAADGDPGDNFGVSVALDGGSALIGAKWDSDNGTNSGSAYIFVGSGGSWAQQTKLTGTGGEHLGASVALDGDTALIGADGNKDNGFESGSAYTFVRSGTVWTQQAKLIATDGASNDEFGYSVALSGDTALIGAEGDDDNGSFTGSAYIFVHSGTTWMQQAKLTAADGVASDVFGRYVALSGDTALIGAIGDDDNGSNSGSAYIFIRSGTVWTQQAKLTASDGTANDTFGRSVALSGDTALIGAEGDDDNGSFSGSAYLFVKPISGWATTGTYNAKLTAADGAANDSFGRSVALSGDTALIGAIGDEDNGTTSGSAYIFVISGTTWVQQAKLTAADGAAGDTFGRSVALSGDTALIGASGDDDNGSNSGSAYIFIRSGTVWTQQAKLTAADGAAADSFGRSVALSGDTALIGAHLDDDNGFSSGSAYLFVKPATAWVTTTQTAKLTASDGASGDEFGWSVALDGDTALIGAYGDDDKGSFTGSAYIYHFACGYGRELRSNIWTMVGLPCEPGVANTVQDLFADSVMTPANYNNSWSVWERNELADNYTLLSLGSPLTQGHGYWVFTLNSTAWHAAGTDTPVSISNPNCTSIKGCFEIELIPPGVAQPPLFNLIGHVFSSDIAWDSVRFEVDGVAYTPSQAEAAGFADKKMWLYNGNGYDVYDDATPGLEGTLVSQDGIWTAVHAGAAGKTVWLLIPASNVLGTPPPPP